MQRTNRRQVVGACISVLILIAGVAGFMALTYRPPTEAAEPPPNRPQLVKTVRFHRHEGALDVVVDGVVVPFREVRVSAEVSGRIARKSKVCRAGTFVSEGALLCEVDPRDYELRVERLTSELDQASANIEELEVQISNTEELVTLAKEDLALQRGELQRLENLSAGNLVADTELDKGKRAELQSRNALVTLQNQTQLFKTQRNRLKSGRQLVETDLKQAKLDLQRTRVTAPSDGVIVADMVEQGDFVQKGANLVLFEDTSAVEVRCNLRMKELYWLWRQDSTSTAPPDARRLAYEISPTPATIAYQISQTQVSYQWQGELDRFEGIGVDGKTRTIPCRISVRNPLDATVHEPSSGSAKATRAPALVRGMYVTVTIHIEPPTKLTRIPERAVRPGKSLYVVRDGKLHIIRSVPLIELIDVVNDDGESERVWIADVEGLQLEPNDQIITSPMVVYTPGMPVRVEGVADRRPLATGKHEVEENP